MIRISLGAAFREIVRGIKILLILAFTNKHKNADIGVQMVAQHFDNAAPSIFTTYGIVETKNDGLCVGFHSYECIGIDALCKQS